ncbi:MAG: recombinase family protein [Gemmataceae bacterium]
MSVVGYVGCNSRATMERQQAEITQCCEKNGWKLAGFLVNRDHLYLRDVVNAGLVHTLVVAHTNDLPFMYEEDRERLFKALADHGAGIVSVSEGEVQPF